MLNDSEVLNNVLLERLLRSLTCEEVYLHLSPQRRIAIKNRSAILHRELFRIPETESHPIDRMEMKFGHEKMHPPALCRPDISRS